MNNVDRVAVCSRSFSKNSVLRNELLMRYKYVDFNDAGSQLYGDDLVNFLSGHSKAIIGLEVITKEVLVRVPELQVVSKYGVGTDSLDMKALRQHGVKLGWKGGVNRRSVSELVIALTIMLLRRIPQAHQSVVSGEWQQQIGGLLSERTVGVVG